MATSTLLLSACFGTPCISIAPSAISCHAPIFSIMVNLSLHRFTIVIIKFVFLCHSQCHFWPYIMKLIYFVRMKWPVTSNQPWLFLILLFFLQADVDDRLPLTLLDPNSIQFDTNYKCESGQVVVDGQCVPCQPGTYYNEAEKVCTKCAIGFYNSDFAKLACTKCPLIQDVEGITKAEGADTIDDCKQRCSVGQKYSDESGICINCGFGKYQPKEGQFECLSCGNGLTTRSGTASSVDECRPDCLDGFQMGPAGECEVCPVGSYRSRDKVKIRKLSKILSCDWSCH